jgi:hypothetical protein
MNKSYLKTTAIACTMLIGALTINAKTFSISAGDVSALRSALASVAPGDIVQLAAGTYSLTSGLDTSKDGAAGKYITIRGAGSSTKLQLEANDGAVLTIGNDYYKVENLYLDANKKGTKGLLIEEASHGYVTNVTVQKSLNECFKIRKNSHYWLISNCTVKYAGQSGEMYGEGFYVSDADQNWKTKPNADHTGYITFLNCTVYQCPNDGFDLKEGSHNIKIIGCTIDFGNIQTSTDRGSNAIFNRAKDVQVINCTYKNNMNSRNGGWLVVADRSYSTITKTFYGDIVEIKNCTITNTELSGSNRDNVVLSNEFSTAKIYKDTPFTYTGSKPDNPAASTFDERGWGGEGGGIYGN